MFTAAAWLAELALRAMPLAEREGFNGLFHATPLGQTTWHGYAQYVLTQAASQGWTFKATADQVHPITTAQYPLPAQRPAYGLLDSSLLARSLQCDWPDWQAGVNQVIAQLSQHLPAKV